MAHIGAIEELERQGFEIAAVAGTSMGALVGGGVRFGPPDGVQGVDDVRSTSTRSSGWWISPSAPRAWSRATGSSRRCRSWSPTCGSNRCRFRLPPWRPICSRARGGARPRRVVRGYPGLDLHPFGLPACAPRRDGARRRRTVNPLPLNRVRREEGDLLVAVDVKVRRSGQTRPRGPTLRSITIRY